MASSGKQTLMDGSTLNSTTVGSSFSLVPRSDSHVGYIKARNVNGATTVTGVIEHSPDGENWFTLVNFAAIAGVDGQEIVQITDNVLSQVRANVTLAGGVQQADVTCEVHYRERS